MRRVLLVEDNHLNRELLRTVLESTGCQVDEAENGLDALTLLRQYAYDMVLTDLQMPLMSGSELLAEMRKPGPFTCPKVLAVTAYAMRGDRERALAEGFDGYITKPIQVTEFRAQIKALLAECPSADAVDLAPAALKPAS